jgi:hypothetical protein
MARADEDFGRNVFINCPCDERYVPLLQALLFTIVHLGYTPRIALERSDSGEIRLQKISDLIRRSRFSIHDLSRTQAAEPGEFYRMNMPFEFGVDYGCRLFGQSGLRRKRCLVLSGHPFDHVRALSDASGIDVKHHNHEPLELMRQVRNWFVETAEAREVPSASTIWRGFIDFMLDFNGRRVADGYSPEDLNTMPVREFVGFIARWVAGRG